MNPSRVSTPRRKLIDEWHFKFNQKVVKFTISMRRPRDAQHDPEKGLPPLIKFFASVSSEELLMAGINKGEFPAVTLEDDDLNRLRNRCQQHIQSVFKLDWRKCIVVGFSHSASSEMEEQQEGLSFRDRRRLDEHIKLAFDFAVAETASGYYRHIGTTDADYFDKSITRCLRGCSWEKEEVHAVEYDERVLESLIELKKRYGRLNALVKELLAPKNHDQFLIAMQVGNLLQFSSEEHEQIHRVPDSRSTNGIPAGS